MYINNLKLNDIKEIERIFIKLNAYDEKDDIIKDIITKYNLQERKDKKITICDYEFDYKEVINEIFYNKYGLHFRLYFNDYIILDDNDVWNIENIITHIENIIDINNFIELIKTSNYTYVSNDIINSALNLVYDRFYDCKYDDELLSNIEFVITHILNRYI